MRVVGIVSHKLNCEDKVKGLVMK